MAGKSAILSIKILADARDAQKGLKATSDGVGKFQSGIKKAAVPAGLALAGIATAAMDAGKAAAEDAQSQAILATAMKNNAGATDATIKSTEDHISAMSAASGVADDQLRPAMGNLVRATGSATKSQDALQVALDVAAATGQDVETVTKAMAKGYGGNTKALGKLVPGMDKATLASGDMNKVMGELAKKTGGSSAAAADTAAGKMQRMKVAMDEAKESIGAALLPVMGTFADVLSKVANAAGSHPGLFKAIAIVIGVVAGAIVLLNVALGVYETVMAVVGIVSGAAWAAALWPILLVIAAVAAVIVIIVLLWKKCDWFRAVVIAIWNAIKAAAVAVWNWIKNAWTTMVSAMAAVINGFKSVVSVVWNAIKTAISAVISWIRNAWAVLMGALKTAVNGVKTVASNAFNGIKTVVQSVVKWVGDKWNAMVDGIKAVMSGLGSVLSAPFNAVKDAVNHVVGAVQDLIGWLGRIKIPKISLPHIPGFNATAATPGVGGGFTASALAAPAAGGRATSGGITINVSGAIDPEATARQISRLLDAHTRRMGQQGTLRAVGAI